MISRRTLFENTAKGGLALRAGGLIGASGSSSSSSATSGSSGVARVSRSTGAR